MDIIPLYSFQRQGIPVYWHLKELLKTDFSTDDVNLLYYGLLKNLDFSAVDVYFLYYGKKC